MGKHSDQNTSWAGNARTLLRDLAASRRAKSVADRAPEETAPAATAGGTFMSRRELRRAEALAATQAPIAEAAGAGTKAGTAPTPLERNDDTPTVPARSGAPVATATGVLGTVRSRPMVAAIALPAAASIAIVAGAFTFAPEATGTVVAEAPTPEQAEAPSAGAHEDHAAQSEVSVPRVEDAAESPAAELPGAEPAPEPEPTVSEEDREAAKDEAASQYIEDVKSERSEDASADTSRSASREDPGVSSEPCDVSSSIESGISANAQAVYRAVCAEFPVVDSYGGYRNDSDSDHGSGNAVDVMITGSTGDAIADYVLEHADELGVKYVIWEQAIKYPGGSWKSMEDRGSATANHFDHVHVSVN